MKALAASMGSLAAVGLIVGGAGAAFACDFHAEHVVQATPAPAETVATPATRIDLTKIAQLEKAAILPVAPKVETVEESEAD